MREADFQVHREYSWLNLSDRYSMRVLKVTHLRESFPNYDRVTTPHVTYHINLTSMERTIPTNQWLELVDTLQFHAGLAHIANAATQFRLGLFVDMFISVIHH